MQKTIANLKNERQALIEISTQLRAQLNTIQGPQLNTNFIPNKDPNAFSQDLKKNLHDDIEKEEEEKSLHKLTLNKLKKQYQEDFLDD